jgi:hypothetical protein
MRAKQPPSMSREITRPGSGEARGVMCSAVQRGTRGCYVCEWK